MKETCLCGGRIRIVEIAIFSVLPIPQGAFLSLHACEKCGLLYDPGVISPEQVVTPEETKKCPKCGETMGKSIKGFQHPTKPAGVMISHENIWKCESCGHMEPRT